MIHYSNLWQLTIENIEKKISPKSYDTWFKPTTQINFSDGIITVQVPNDFAKDWLESRYLSIIKNAIEEETRENVLVQFVFPDPQVNGQNIDRGCEQDGVFGNESANKIINLLGVLAEKQAMIIAQLENIKALVAAKD